MLLCRKKNKLGVSVMVGYVLLITFAIIIGFMVYNWMKSYVPTETLECPDGVSILMKNINCEIDGDNYNLSLKIVNNGRFAINGSYIKYAIDPDFVIGTEDIENENIVSGLNLAGGILFFEGKKSLEPDESAHVELTLSNLPYLIQITPIRYEIIEGKTRLAVCINARTKEKLNCPGIY